MGLALLAERVGRTTLNGVAEIGYAASLFGESLYWLVMGWRRHQPVRADAVIAQMMDVGIHAIPIVAVMAGTIGIMLAIQGIYTLRTFGAETRVVAGVALSVTREFAPLITGILVAGRSGSALAARLGSMRINQELDVLKVMGISPVRFLVVPVLIAGVVMMPALTFLADLTALGMAGVYVGFDLGMSFHAYVDQTINILRVSDILHGLVKSGIFAVLITLIGVANGSSVEGGAEGVGRATTRAVVQAISAIIVVDMIFVFAMTRQ
ncbi:MAG: ABC transporter permease [Alphaproteobacteria bacterium]|nr:ABC transporter permease [Alphaproteobacteria bacterium]MBF0128978.1 ABC transporter permease [Alphaproteobacteria bacterium]